MARFTVGRHLGKIIQRVLKINASTKSLVERLCDIKIYVVSVLGYIGSISAPDKATLKAEAHALQCAAAGPYNAIPTSPRPLSNCRVFEYARPRPSEDPGSSRVWLCSCPCAQLHLGKRNFLLLPWLVAMRKRSVWYIVWTAVANLMN